MTDGGNKDSKTEEPSEKKISDSIEKGNLPFSREAITLGSLLSILVVCKFSAAPFMVHLTESMARLLAGAGTIRLEGLDDVTIQFAQVANNVVIAVLPVLAVIAGGGLLASLAQNMPQFNSQRIAPTYSRISPASGWKRLFGLPGLVEFLKTTFKFVSITAIAILVMKSDITQMLNSLDTDPLRIPQTILDMFMRIIAALGVVSAILMAADITWSRRKWRNDLRMSKQEMKDEHKQAEGDPHLKQRVRTIARRRVSRQMMTKLPTATVVIANPTHFAVALRYLREEGGAPVVVSKGVDHLALRIREMAKGHGIPVVENKLLARALYESVEMDDAIPAEFYKAVAEIIHFLQIRKMYTAPAARP